LVIVAALGTGVGFWLRADRGAAPPEDVSAVVKGNNEFAFDLYGRLRGREGNLFFSPESIATALGMAHAGARGDTADEMAKALHFPLDQGKLSAAHAALLRERNGGGRQRGYELSVVNALWGQRGHGFGADFLKLLRKDYGAGLQEVDFKGDAEGARRQINAWVEKQTRDKIKDVIGEGGLSTDSRLVLTNAIYFKGDWDSRFQKVLTRDGPFRLSAAEQVQVPMMHQTKKFGYFDGGSFQALEMPYVGKELAMVVLLPKEADGLAELEKSLTADALAGWTSRLAEENVQVALPRFKTSSAFSLKDTLSDMGMKRAFEESADFSGMGGQERLCLSAVVHKAYVDVNEEGTEAAAATAVGVHTVSWEGYLFIADHPFVFLIRDTRDGGILFLGRVVNPTP
jgi:serpin B